MEDFEYFEGWNKFLRWLLFIPMILITYTIVYFVGRWIIFTSVGWVGISNTSTFGYIVSGFHINFICFFLAFTVSVSCAPKGRIIISSIYLGLIIFSLGFSTLSVITYGDFSGAPNWVVAYNYILNFSATLWVLVMVIADERQKKKDFMSRISDILEGKRLDNEKNSKDPVYTEREELIKNRLGL